MTLTEFYEQAKKIVEDNFNLTDEFYSLFASATLSHIGYDKSEMKVQCFINFHFKGMSINASSPNFKSSLEMFEKEIKKRIEDERLKNQPPQQDIELT